MSRMRANYSILPPYYLQDHAVGIILNNETSNMRTKFTPYILKPLSLRDTAVRYYFAEGWLTLKPTHTKFRL